MADQDARGGMTSSLVAAVGFIILAVIVVWGFVHLISLSRPYFGSLFGMRSGVSVSAPKAAPAGTETTLSWKNSTSDKGSYSFLYQCKKGVTLAAGGRTIPCGVAQPLGTATSLSVVPSLSGSSTSVSVPLSIIFAPTATGTRSEGGATLSVTAPSVESNHPASGTPPQEGNPTPSTGTTAEPTNNNASAPVSAQEAANLPDLSVRIVAIGIINETGAFVRANPRPGDEVAVQFDIANGGAVPTGSWNFTAHLPAGNGGYDYASPTQASLKPEGHILNTLKFTDYTPGDRISITVDPENKIQEKDKANNAVSVQI